MLRSELGDNLGMAFDNPEYFPDLQLSVVNSTTKTDVSMFVHKCVLAARSPTFREILRQEKTDTLVVHTDKDVALYRALVQYPSLSLPISTSRFTVSFTYGRYLYIDQIDPAYVTLDMKDLATEYGLNRLAKICSKKSIAIPPSLLSKQFRSLITGKFRSFTSSIYFYVIFLIDEEFKGELQLLAEGQTVDVHRVFLCTRCKYFKYVFILFFITTS